MLLVYRYRVKSLNGLLNQQARAVNVVWNYCNDRQKDALRYSRPWLSGFDLNKLTAGSSKELELHSGTINAVCEQFAKSRAQKNRPFLRYRNKKALGWIPLKGRMLKQDGQAFRFWGHTFRVFNSRSLPNGRIKDGTNFSCDRQGHWFLNIVVEVPDAGTKPPIVCIGIDLGLEHLANLSDGSKISAQHFYRNAGEMLAKAQKANKTKRVRAIHCKVANRRNDFLHKESTRLVRSHDFIAVGNVNAASMAKTKLSKSVQDAGWSTFRSMLAYKAVKHGAWYFEVDERFTTQTCSNCGELPDSRPKGIAGLGIREWKCSSCGQTHDRDVNAALNILRRGRATLAAGTSRSQR